MTKLKSETIRYDQLDGESGNLLDDLKAWVENFRFLVCRPIKIHLTTKNRFREPIKVFQKESQKSGRKFPRRIERRNPGRSC